LTSTHRPSFQSMHPYEDLDILLATKYKKTMLFCHDFGIVNLTFVKLSDKIFYNCN